jgi:hypothetical protein
MSEKVRLSSFSTLGFAELDNNFYYDVLQNEYEKYKVQTPNGAKYNIPAERRSQLQLIQNTSDELHASSLDEDEKVMTLMGAMLLVQGLIYDSYWVKANATNSEVYKNTPAAMGITDANKLDLDTEKAAMLAFRNYYLAHEGEKNSLLADVDPAYLDSKYISSYISSKVNPQLTDAALADPKLKRHDLPAKRTKVEDVAIRTGAPIANVYSHYNMGLFRDIKSFNKANLKKLPVKNAVAEEMKEISLKLKNR